MLLEICFHVCYKDEDKNTIRGCNNLGNYSPLSFEVKGNSTIQRVIESSQHKCKQNGRTKF